MNITENDKNLTIAREGRIEIILIEKHTRKLVPMNIRNLV